MSYDTLNIYIFKKQTFTHKNINLIIKKLQYLYILKKKEKKDPIKKSVPKMYKNEKIKLIYISA